MIKNFKQYNESIRDKMTPITDDEIEKVFTNLIKDDSIMRFSDFKNWKSGELEEISELTETPMDKLYYMDEESYNFEKIHDYMVNILDITLSKGEIPVEVKSSHGNRCFCYPERKIAYWFEYDVDDVVAWAFSEDVFKNK